MDLSPSSNLQAGPTIVPASNQASYTEAMEHLVEVVQRLSLARTLDAIMAIVRQAARALTGADGATFVLREDDQCFYADEDAITPLWKGQRFPMKICLGGWVMTHRQPALIRDISGDDRLPYAAYQPTFIKSLAMVPIRTTAPIGAIGTYWATLHQPTVEEVKLLQALADTTAVALENVQVYAKLEQRVRDRTVALELANQRLQELSLTDDLTGLLNRRGFFLLAEQSFKLAQQTQTPCSLLFIDLDGLKHINDTLGHEMGDRAIVNTAHLLKQTFHESEIVARLGGDEFVVFLSNSLEPPTAMRTRLQANLVRFNQERSCSHQLSMSVGVQQCPLSEKVSLEHLVALADALMYEQKRAKRSSPKEG